MLEETLLEYTLLAIRAHKSVRQSAHNCTASLPKDLQESHMLMALYHSFLTTLPREQLLRRDNITTVC